MYTALKVVAMFDDDDIEATRLNILIHIFVPLITYLSTILIFNWIFRMTVISWIDNMLYPQSVIEIIEVVQENDSQQDQIQTHTVEISKPIFLKRLSDTLFTRSNKKDNVKIQE